MARDQLQGGLSGNSRRTIIPGRAPLSIELLFPGDESAQFKVGEINQFMKVNLGVDLVQAGPGRGRLQVNVCHIVIAAMTHDILLKKPVDLEFDCPSVPVGPEAVKVSQLTALCADAALTFVLGIIPMFKLPAVIFLVMPV